MAGPARMYFSFRSPYSWLAAERIQEERIPVDPRPMNEVPEGMTAIGADTPNIAKLSYIREDVIRLAGAKNLKVVWPRPFDTDWFRAHAAFWAARKTGNALGYMVAAFRARFLEGADLADARIVRVLAKAAGADPDAAVAALSCEKTQGELDEVMIACKREGVFGVPFFLYEGQKFWGQDRLDALKQVMGKPANTP